MPRLRLLSLGLILALGCSKSEAPKPEQQAQAAPTVAETPPGAPASDEGVAEAAEDEGDAREVEADIPSADLGAPEPLPVPKLNEEQVKQVEAEAAADLERAGNLALDLTDALKSGKVENILALTPFDGGEFAKACKDTTLPDPNEVKARAKHCLRSIKWDKVTDVRVDGGEALSDPSACEGYDAHERVRMLVVASNGNTEIDLNAPIGKDGQAVAFTGAMSCKPHGG